MRETKVLIQILTLSSLRTIFSTSQLKPSTTNVDKFVEDKFFRRVRQTLQETNSSTRNLSNNNRTFETCFTPDGEPGHCKMTSLCDWDVLQENPSNYIDYFCVIEGSIVGVCCPDNLAEKPLDSTAGSSSLPRIKQHTDCGVNGRSSKVIRTLQQSNKNDWPWMAVLRYAAGDFSFCGGALLNRRYVLTAAHCLKNLTETDVVVRLGEYDFRTSDETQYVDFIVDRFIIHEDYDAADQHHDIALIKLFRSAVYNRYVRPICLSYTETEDNETAIVAGWGTQTYKGSASKVLMEVPVPIWNIDVCSSKFVQNIFYSNICAAGYDGEKDSCQGDSGGPLLKQLPNGRWTTIGIVSWGIGCGHKDSPGVYTKVKSYIKWIAGHVADSKP